MLTQWKSEIPFTPSFPGYISFYLISYLFVLLNILLVWPMLDVFIPPPVPETDAEDGEDVPVKIIPAVVPPGALGTPPPPPPSASPSSAPITIPSSSPSSSASVSPPSGNAFPSSPSIVGEDDDEYVGGD
jgi:hypothetical protein